MICQNIEIRGRGLVKATYRVIPDKDLDISGIFSVETDDSLMPANSLPFVT
jgi:hypothetical protein